MFVRAVVKEGIHEQAILIPQQTVSRDPKGNPAVLIVDAEGKVQQRMLTLDRAIGDGGARDKRAGGRRRRAAH